MSIKCIKAKRIRSSLGTAINIVIPEEDYYRAESVTACIIRCRDCSNTLLIENWQNAKHYGWCVPIDGGLQRCPECAESFYEETFGGIEEISKG